MEKKDFKANEWRDIAFYLIIPILSTFLEKKHFHNLVQYIIFLRILCNDSITEQDLSDAQVILNLFIVDFEKLYGIDSMTFNLHSHLHLIKQVRRFGPLTKSAGFCFENMFFITRKMCKGTRNFEGQLGRKLTQKQNIKIEINKLKKNSSENSRLNEYISKYIDKDLKLTKNTLLNSKKICIRDLSDTQRQVILNFSNKYNCETEIHQSETSVLNSKSNNYLTLYLSSLN